MKDKILKWLFTGNVGGSSKAMVAAVLGYPTDGSYPLDPDDLNRCLKLLAAVPEIRNHQNKIAELSDTWRKLINKWPKLEATFLKEVGLDWCKGDKAPNTYELMRQSREYPE